MTNCHTLCSNKHFVGSAVSIVYCYGLDDWAIEVRSPGEAKGFFLQPLCPDRLWGPPSLLSPQAPPWRVVGLLYFTIQKLQIAILYAQTFCLSLHKLLLSYTLFKSVPAKA
jgi:hypothetical protein